VDQRLTHPDKHDEVGAVNLDIDGENLAQYSVLQKRSPLVEDAVSSHSLNLLIGHSLIIQAL